MTKQKAPYTESEISLAKTLFSKAQKAGTLKSPRPIAAAAFSNGYRFTVNASSVTFRDYFRDARRLLASDPGSRKRRG